MLHAGAEVATQLRGDPTYMATASQLDTLQAGTIFPLMFGHVGTIRPSCVISMQSANYKVNSVLPNKRVTLPHWQVLHSGH